MYRLLSEGLFVYNDFTICNFTLLDDKDFLKVFESNTVYVYDNCRDEAKYFVNKVIRDIIIDDRFIDIQFSFFRDNRDRRGCTRKQLDILSDILFNNYEYELNDTQLTFLSNVEVLSKRLLTLLKIQNLSFGCPATLLQRIIEIIA